MMKRIFAAALFCVVALSLSVPALAAYLKHEPLKFRTHKATAATGEILVDDLTGTTECKSCAIDSMAFRRLGATGTTLAAAQAETTTAISTAGWARPGAGAAAGDTMLVFRVTFTDGTPYVGSGTFANDDSLIVGVQVSANGRNWNYVNPVKDVAGANPITATSPAVAGFPVLESGGDGATFSLGFSAGICGLNLPDRYNCWQWPLMRFIVVNAHAATYQALTCTVTRWAE